MLIKEENQRKTKMFKKYLKLFETIILGSYIMKLGTIIAGNRFEKNLKITNIGK